MSNITNITSVKTTLDLGPIQKTQNGSYLCTTLDGTSFDKIDILVQTRPSIPEIITIKWYPNYTKIKWKIVDYGELNLTAILIEWSKNFTNPLLDTNLTLIEFPTKDEDLMLNLSLPGYLIRLTAFNILGSSNKSNESLTECGFCNDYSTFSTLPTQTLTTSPTTQSPYILIGSISGGVLVAVIIAIVVAFLIARCRSKPPKRYDSRLDILSNMKDSLDNSEQIVYSPEKSFVSQYSGSFNYSQFFESTYSIESLYETWKSKINVIDKELMNEFTVNE